MADSAPPPTPDDEIELPPESSPGPAPRDAAFSGHEALLGLLSDNRSTAEREYGRIRRRLVYLFEGRGARFPEDLADETLATVAGKLAAGQSLEIYTEDPYSYFRGVAKRVFLAHVREVRRERVAVTRLRHEPEPSAGEESDPRLDALRECLGELPDRDRKMALEYFGEGAAIPNRKRLAQSLELTLNALRVRMHRLRRALEECVGRRLGGAGRNGSP